MRNLFIAIITGIFVIAMPAMGVNTAINIIDMGNGSFNFIDAGSGQILGSASNRAMAEKFAQSWIKKGSTINWATNTTANAASSGTSAAASAAKATTGTTSAAGKTAAGWTQTQSGVFTNANGTTHTNFQWNGQQYTYETTTSGKGGGFKSAGKYVSRPEGMVPATTAQPGANLPATTPKPGANLPATTAQPGTNLPATTTPSTTTPAPTTVTGTATKVTATQVATGALGLVGMGLGAYEVYKSGEAKETKATWGDVARGASGGFSFGSGSVMFLNAIPGVGNIAYGTIVAAATVVGASVALTKMFSETDCILDPVMGQQACCNISKLSNIEAIRLNIGGKMFCDYPGIRTCVQGHQEFTEEQPWFKARFLDDHWTETCQPGFCPGYVEPEGGDFNIQIYANTNDVCWFWECADAGYIRDGAKCIPGTVVPNITVGDACDSASLPQYATAGVWVSKGTDKQTGTEKFACAATACIPNTYLVHNERGVSMGWCVAASYCNKEPGTHLNIIDETKTDLTCVPNAVATPDNASQDTTPQTPCMLGTVGYMLHNGECISVVEYQQILLDTQAAARVEQEKQREYQAHKQRIRNKANAVMNITSGFDVSVWRNEDGEFNTARLASDSIAGVVLGTAGGLITNKIIKKNQAENGFEALQCTVAGQVVANWGDEFTVGRNLK